MLAWHFLNANWTSLAGNEPPWRIREKRVINGEPVLCESGYHFCDSPYHAIKFAPGPVCCLVKVDDGPIDDQHKGVSKQRELIMGHNISSELRRFVLECAEVVVILVDDIPAVAQDVCYHIRRTVNDDTVNLAELQSKVTSLINHIQRAHLDNSELYGLVKFESDRLCNETKILIMNTVLHAAHMILKQAPTMDCVRQVIYHTLLAVEMVEYIVKRLPLNSEAYPYEAVQRERKRQESRLNELVIARFTQ